MTTKDQLLHQAMEPLGDILTPLEALLKTEKVAMFLFPAIFLPLGFAVLSEYPGRLIYFPVVVIGVVILFILTLRRYRKLKALYHKIEDWPYTSKEALMEARSAVIRHLPKLYGPPILYGLMLFSSLVNLFKEDSRQFFRNIFYFQNPFEGVAAYVPLILVGVPVLLTYMASRTHKKFLNKNYREPLNRLQEIIERFDHKA